jgi:hypothetical protein
MTNREQIQRDIAIAFDFVEQILDNSDMLDQIPDGTSITFLDDENVKLEKHYVSDAAKQYVKVKRHFEVL